MGAAGSVEVKNLSRKIDEGLRKDYLIDKALIKLLLLGPGESGKSTILKQMRILHANGFSEQDFIQQTKFVFCNTLGAIVTILDAMPELEIMLADKEREADKRLVLAFLIEKGDGCPFTKEIVAAMKRLWQDSGVQTCFQRANEFQLSDSAQYFLDSVERMAAPDFRANQDDILRIRITTTGVVEVMFKMRGLDFKVFDVGGQRTERKKWIHCFDNVSSIIFIVAISEYDQLLFEDGKTNRLMESMHLFDSICNSLLFCKTSMILFLNKNDLFAAKIKRAPLKILFPDYKGGSNYEEASQYVQKRFDRLNKNLERIIYSHFTCATDTTQIQFVLDSTIDNIIQQNMKTSGIE